MSAHLLRELESVKRSILCLGMRVEAAIDNAVQAMVERDLDRARRVIEADAEIDRLEVEIEEECLKLMALYQPVAVDLRFLIAVLKMNNDLERMGDLAGNIAKGALWLTSQDPVPVPNDLPLMADKARSMVRRSLDALVHGDADLARRVCADDDEVDALRKSVAGSIKSEIRRSPEKTDPLMTLFMSSGTLERLGDMATNIAEDVIYMLEGRIIRHRGHSSDPQT